MTVPIMEDEMGHAATANQRDRSITLLIPLTALAGSAAGLLDAAYFSTLAVANGSTPIRTLQGIAGFWLGEQAATGGFTSALLGLVTHFGLATIMAAGYVIAARKLVLLRTRPLVAGPIYGLFLYAVMYLIVLPLRWPTIFPLWSGWTSVLDVALHVCVGLTIALIASRTST